MPKVTFKIETQAPTASINKNGSSENLELFHGIGNTLGFNITGGKDFNTMPITIFFVSINRLLFLVHVLFVKNADSRKKMKKEIIRNSMVANERKIEIEDVEKIGQLRLQNQVKSRLCH